MAFGFIPVKAHDDPFVLALLAYGVVGVGGGVLFFDPFVLFEELPLELLVELPPLELLVVFDGLVLLVAFDGLVPLVDELPGFDPFVEFDELAGLVPFVVPLAGFELLEEAPKVI